MIDKKNFNNSEDNALNDVISLICKEIRKSNKELHKIREELQKPKKKKKRKSKEKKGKKNKNGKKGKKHQSSNKSESDLSKLITTCVPKLIDLISTIVKNRNNNQTDKYLQLPPPKKSWRGDDYEQ